MTSTQQFDLDFSGKLPPSAQEGMARCDSSANPLWKRWTDGAIQAVARANEYFTADEVIEVMQSLHGKPSTHNPSAMGPRLKEVSKTLKYMEPTDQVRRSKREASHGNFLRLWKSLIWEGEK